MDSCSADHAGVIKCAGQIIYREKWRICRKRAAAHPLGTTSLHWTALFPGSTVIRVVALDGVVIGQVRRHGGRWIATAAGGGCGSLTATPSPPPYSLWPVTQPSKPTHTTPNHGWGERL